MTTTAQTATAVNITKLIYTYLALGDEGRELRVEVVGDDRDQVHEVRQHPEVRAHAIPDFTRTTVVHACRQAQERRTATRTSTIKGGRAYGLAEKATQVSREWGMKTM